MDTKTVGMAVSASAIGAALAYLGLTNYNDESISLNTEEDQHDKKLTQVENTTDAVSKAVNSKVDEIIIKKSGPLDVTEKINNLMSKEGDSEQNAQNNEFETEEELKRDEDNIKGEVKNAFEKEAWGKFWKSEYKTVDKNGTIKPGINSDGFQ